MKKSYIFSSSAIILSGFSFLIFFLGYPVPAQIVVLAAIVFSLAGMNKITSRFDLAAVFVSFVSLGILFDLLVGGIPYHSLTMALAALFFVLRLFLMEQLLYNRALWIEPFFFFTALLVWIAGNIFYGVSWLHWISPGLVMAFGLMNTIGAFADIRLAPWSVKQRYLVENGNAAPDFILPDHDGKSVSFSSLIGERPILLLFVKGDWCPGCHIMLRTYQRRKEEFRKKNIMLLAVGPDPAGVNKKMVENLELDYLLLSDDRHEAAKKYGVAIHANNPMTKYPEGIPLPASFLVDTKGIIRFTSRPDKVGEILSPDRIFSVLQALN
jgi:peroxiredoxin